ncbi:disease resistance protein [Salix suchowensis]|nr:disease resistance protein [Salix suchowensis]
MKVARQNDPFWDYVEKLDDAGPFNCTFCGYKFSAATSVSRIKWHLSGVKGRGVKICEKVPGDVQDSAREAIDGPPEKKHKAIEGSSNNELANTISTSAQVQNYGGRLVEMAEQGQDFSPGELEGWMDSITDKEIEFMLGTERAHKDCEGRTSGISSLFMEDNSASNCIENTTIATGLMQHSERGSSHERLTINQVDTRGDSSRPIDLLCPDPGRRYYQLCSSSLNNDAIMNDVENMIREPGQPFVRDGSREVLQRNGDESRGDAFPTKKLVGAEFENNKNAIWSWIMNDEASSSFGIFGMGGVGKTTLLMHIYNLLLETSNHFCHISWITVSQDFSIYKLQNLIAKDIHLDLSNEDNKWKRAAKLSKALTKKQPWVLIFDDLWNCFDFDEVGIPILLKGCKLIHTTRSKNVCQRMDTQHIIKVKPILEEEAWTLFIERLGHDIAPSTEAEDIAKSITKECDGLPLGIITMAGTMKGIDDIHEWRNALEDLRQSRVRQDDMEEEVFRILRFSYSHLKDSALQQCFLYCALFPPDFMIPRKNLVRYLIDEGIIKGFNSRVAEFDKGYSMLNRLENVCLLESAKRYDDRRCVKMHDLIRDMAIQIQQENSQAMVKAGAQLKELPDVEEWTENLVRVSLIQNQIEEISWSHSANCPNLSTLLLCHNEGLRFIADSFFKQLLGLKVLDLSYSNIADLADSVSDLVSLNALLLEGCVNLRHVPSLKKLRALKRLDLCFTALKKIPQGMECLSSLRYLRMNGCGQKELPSGILPKLSRLQVLVLEEWMPTIFVPVTVKGKQVGCLRKLETLECHFESHSEFVEYLKYQNENQPLSTYRISVGLQDEDDYNSKWYCRDKDKSVWFGNLSIKKDGDFQVMSPNGIQQVLCRCIDATSLSDVLSLNYETDLEVIDIKECNTMESLVSSFWFSSAPLPFPSLNGIFSSLKEFYCVGCNSMKKLFPHVLLPNLVNLEEIRVEECEKIEEIIGTRSDGERVIGEESSSTTKFRLPKLRNLRLKQLPELKNIYSAQLICDSLENIDVLDCQKLEKMPICLWLLENGQPYPLPSLRRVHIKPKEWWESVVESEHPDAKDVLLPFVDFW